MISYYNRREHCQIDGQLRDKSEPIAQLVGAHCRKYLRTCECACMRACVCVLIIQKTKIFMFFKFRLMSFMMPDMDYLVLNSSK